MYKISLDKLLESSLHSLCLIAGIIFAGQIQVVGPSQAVTVMVGDDIILPCHLKPASDASGMTFEWARPDLKPRFVHVWHEGQDLHVNQHSSFKGRTSVDITELKHGDISLKLSKVKHSDRGIYRCYFPDLDKEITVQLVVGKQKLFLLFFFFICVLRSVLPAISTACLT